MNSQQEVKHTPGPWEAVGWAVHADNGREIIFGQHNTRSAASDERAANARLIAAAPDLLAALELIASMSGADMDGTRDEWTEAAAFSTAQEYAKAAIARAHGEVAK